MASSGTTFHVHSDDVISYKGWLIDTALLDAILDTKRRVLWAFVRNTEGNIQSVPYDETRCIWLSEDDIQQPNEVEI